MGARRPWILAVIVVAAVSCSSDGSDQGPASAAAGVTFNASVASPDLWAGDPQRFQVGIFAGTPDGGVQLVTFGQVGLTFTQLSAAEAAPPPPTTGTYLPATGTTTTGAGPTLSDPGTARGVYQAEDVTFDQAGSWEVQVTADVEGVGAQRLTAAFVVYPDPQLPAPGQRAVRTHNLTLDSKVPADQIDSRALDGAPVPDPQLHRWTIAHAMADHRPILVIFSTPTYCQSQFCGPDTDAIADLAKRYDDRAVFIHVEVIKKYVPTNPVPSRAAAEWLLRNGDLTEPWLFLIGADGVIIDRWGPLFDVDEVATELQALPPMKS